MNFIQGFDRDQLILMDFESNVAPDSWARVDWFVDSLPLKELGFQGQLQEEGRPPYKASDLLKLLMYCYNLRRFISIFGINELINRLKGLAVSFFWSYKTITTLLRSFCSGMTHSVNQFIPKLIPLKCLEAVNNTYF